MQQATRTAGFLAAVVGAGLAGCGQAAMGSGSSGSGGHSSAASTGPGATTSGTGGGAPACVPGKQASCACIGGGLGVQVCKPDGSGYQACQGCDAGTGGHGGAPTTSAASSTAASSTAASTAAASTAAATTAAGSTAASTGTGSSTCPVGAAGLDLHQATIYANPPDLADWPVTTTLTEVDFVDNGVHLNFSKQDGAGRWPDVTPPGWNGPLQYTLGMAECINGQWYASAVIEFWYGLSDSGGNVALNNQIAMNWYYDPARWGMLAGRQPATGETIGIFIAAGNLRNITTDDPQQSPVMERSNVVLVPMPDVNGAQHSF